MKVACLFPGRIRPEDFRDLQSARPAPFGRRRQGEQSEGHHNQKGLSVNRNVPKTYERLYFYTNKTNEMKVKELVAVVFFYSNYMQYIIKQFMP